MHQPGFGTDRIARDPDPVAGAATRQPLRFRATKWQTKSGDDPTTFSVYGYSGIDPFAAAARKAGATLTTDTFIRAMDTMLVLSKVFGSAGVRHNATERLGCDVSRLSRIQDGRWKAVSDCIKRQS